MSHENEDADREAAHRLAAILNRMTTKARDEFGLTVGAISTALVSAGIKVARDEMGPEATASWLRDIAEEVERDPHPDTVGNA